MVNKRRKKKLIANIRPLLIKEAKKQAGCLKYLCEYAKKEKSKIDPYTLFLEDLYPIFLSKATCMEIGWNRIANKLSLNDMQTHNTFHEAERVVTSEWKEIGRDSGVRAIWREIHQIVSVPSLWEKIIAQEKFGTGWDYEYDIRCPICNERLFERERERTGEHEDGTDIWYWRYFLSNYRCEHTYGIDAQGGDYYSLQELPNEVGYTDIKYALQKIAQKNPAILRRETAGEGDSYCIFYFTDDSSDVLDLLWKYCIEENDLKINDEKIIAIKGEYLTEGNFYELDEYIHEREDEEEYETEEDVR